MKISKKLDALVVGGGLIGLKIFKDLIASGKNAALIEKSGELGGGLLSPQESENFHFSLDSLIWTESQHP